MTRTAVCSLITGGAQIIPARMYTTVRFPFTGESSDDLGMHMTNPPVGPELVTSGMPESGLIWPQHESFAILVAEMQFQDIIDMDNPPTHYRHRLIRDPFAYTGNPMDTTNTTDHLPRPAGRGRTCKSKAWTIFVTPGIPLAYQVYHDARSPMRLEMAQFKMSYSYEVV